MLFVKHMGKNLHVVYHKFYTYTPLII
jgi:hypothetical protein